MRFADKSELNGVADDVGFAAISQFSSIRALAKMGLPLQGMIALKKLVDEIDCMLWSIVPMGLEPKHAKDFKDQCDQVKTAVDDFIVAAKGMASLSEAMK